MASAAASSSAHAVGAAVGVAFEDSESARYSGPGSNGSKLRGADVVLNGGVIAFARRFSQVSILIRSRVSSAEGSSSPRAAAGSDAEANKMMATIEMKNLSQPPRHREILSALPLAATTTKWTIRPNEAKV